MKTLRGWVFLVIILIAMPSVALAWCGNCSSDCCACPGEAQCLDGYSSCEEACGLVSSAPVYTPPPRDYEAEARRANQETGRALHAQGGEAWRNGNIDAAIDLFRQALQYWPGQEGILHDLATALNEKGNVAWSSGNTATAIDYYMQAQVNNPENEVIRSNLERSKADLDQQRGEALAEAMQRQREEMELNQKIERNKVYTNDVQKVVDSFSPEAVLAASSGKLAFGSVSKTAPDAFGTKKANPDLKFGSPSEDLSEKSRNWFNEVGAKIFAKPKPEVPLAVINSDPRMVAVDNEIGQLKEKRNFLELDIRDYKAKEKAAVDPIRKAEIGMYLNNLSQENKALTSDIIKKEEGRKKLHRTIQTEIEQKKEK